MSALYRAFLRSPNFKGKSRIDRAVKSVFFAPRPSAVGDGFSMWLDPMEWTQAELLANGVVEPLTTRLMRKLLSPGDVYVDVGAHVGFHTLTARARVGASGRVVAIEPQPYNCERILQNWSLNGYENLDLLVAVAGARAGTAALHQQAGTDKARLSLALDGVNDRPQRFHVAMVTVDEVVRALAIDRVALAKIDVEGYEPQVIEGMVATLPRCAHVILEALPAESRGQAFLAMMETLRASGFRLMTVSGEPYDASRELPENNVWASRS